MLATSTLSQGFERKWPKNKYFIKNVPDLQEIKITPAERLYLFTSLILITIQSAKYYFLVKGVPGWGPEQREYVKTVLSPQIIIILVSYIIIHYY